jgi:hypothetical protein
VQSFHLAEELARRGWRLEFLVCALDDAPAQVRPTRLGPARVLYRRRTSKTLGDKVREKLALYETLRRVDTDLVFERAVWDADVAALACRSRRRPFVYGLASDRDAVALPRWSRRRNALRLATAIVAQTESQRDWMRRYGRQSTRIGSGFPVPETGATAKHDVLWVGTLRRLKRPEIFLELAAAMPEHSFVRRRTGESRACGRVAARATALPNLRRWLPANTSTARRFPNTFVPRAARGGRAVAGRRPTVCCRAGESRRPTSALRPRSGCSPTTHRDAIAPARAWAVRRHDIRRM